MSIEFKREGNACERCKKQDIEAGKITHYTKHGADLLLCPKCLEDKERTYTEKCPKCKRVAHEHGGMSAYGDEPPLEEMCLECVQKKEARDAKKLKIKNFMKDHWKYWITISLTITGIIVALLKF